MHKKMLASLQSYLEALGESIDKLEEKETLSEAQEERLGQLHDILGAGEAFLDALEALT